MNWDPRLDQLGVKYQPNSNAKWTLVSAVYQDDQEAGGNHNIYFRVQDVGGTPLPNIRCVMDWINRDSGDPATVGITGASGQANTPMYANLDITKKNGPYFAYVETPVASDVVTGMGLPEHHHVNFVLTFSRKSSAPQPSPQPPPALRPADPYLASFPRPANDNGRGLHFVLDTRDEIVQRYAPWLKQWQIRWATVYGGDENQCVRVARYLKDTYGIVSNMRVQASGDSPKLPSFWLAFAQKAVAAGLAPYIQVLNEPEDGREGFTSPEHFASLWIPRAQAVSEGGGYPGLQVLSRGFLDAVIRNVADPLRKRIFFSLHNYGANHPPSYPYPYRTVLQDDTTVLRFLAFGQWFNEAWGFVPPMLGGEGGWLYQNHDDATYPLVDATRWIAWHQEMFDWFRKGKLSNGQALPDYLFSINPWLMWASNWYSDSWVDGLDAEGKKPLLDALQKSSPYVRVFSGAAPQPPSQPPPQPPPQPPRPTGLQEAILATANSAKWMPVNNTAGLWKFAKANGLQDQQTDEIEFTYNGETYICQVFNLGIVYVKKGDWGNIKVIRK